MNSMTNRKINQNINRSIKKTTTINNTLIKIMEVKTIITITETNKTMAVMIRTMESMVKNLILLIITTTIKIIWMNMPTIITTSKSMLTQLTMTKTIKATTKDILS